jgi:hypothetical protein
MVKGTPSLGKGEVVSSIRTGSTKNANKIRQFLRRGVRRFGAEKICTHPAPTKRRS